MSDVNGIVDHKMRFYVDELDRVTGSNFFISLLDPLGKLVYEITKVINEPNYSITSKRSDIYNHDIADKCYSENQHNIDESGIYIPLNYKSKFTYGYCFVKYNKSLINDQDAQEPSDFFEKEFFKIIIGVGHYLYSEAMGRIVGSDNPVLYKCVNVEKVFNTGNHQVNAVNNLNINIYSNELTVITGSSGGGKSTFLNLIAGIFPASSGSITCNGHCIDQMKPSQLKKFRRENIGFVYQNYNLIDGLTVLENIKVASCLVSNPMSEIEALKLVHMEDKINAFPNELSGGQQQRVCIARALVKNSGILLCDEPTGALDTTNSLIVLEIINDIIKNNNTSVIMITHNPLITSLANHCFTLSNGRVIDEYFQPFPAKIKDIGLE